MVAFLKDPTGAPLWEENPDAKDVLHVSSEKVSELSIEPEVPSRAGVGCGLCRQ